jgi:protein-L-isoaspartate(D-aspartate) O-methyltransferase
VLADEARAVLFRRGYTNVKVIAGDGTQGYEANAPYDAIIVSAAAAEVPPPLLAQLAEGGRMIIPVGASDAQRLQLIRIRNGRPETTWRETCRFVPLVPGPTRPL